MRNVISEGCEPKSLGVQIREEMGIRSSNGRVELIPKTVFFATGCNIAYKYIGRISQPECRCLIVSLYPVEAIVWDKSRNVPCRGAKVRFEDIGLFITIFCHETMAMCIIRYVAVHDDAMRAMDNNASLVGLADQIARNH